MALIAVVFAFLMHQVAVRALERFAVMRRDVRIDGLHILRFFNQLINIVAARAGSHFRHLRVLHIGTVAGLALQALGDSCSASFSPAEAVPAKASAAAKQSAVSVRFMAGSSKRELRSRGAA